MSKTQQFLAFLKNGNDLGWKNSIPLRNLWEVRIYNNFLTTPSGNVSGNIVQSINNILDFYEGSRNSRGYTVIRNDLLESFGDGTTNGLSFLAQGISLPTDSFGVDYASTPGMGGLKPGYYGMEREKYGSVDIEFIETNKDVFEYFLRPWAIAAAYKGLIEDGKPTEYIKATMDITLYTKGSRLDFDPIGRLNSRQWQARKQYRFTGVVPSTVPGETLSYNNTFEITRKVSFSFKDYAVIG